MRQIPTITKNLLIINIIAFLAYYVLRMHYIDLNDMLGLHVFLASDFHIYQIVTYMFMHGGFTHLFFNMFALWMFGCTLERAWGSQRFLWFYLICGIGAGVIQELSQGVEVYLMAQDQFPGSSFAETMTIISNSSMMLNNMTTVGASGAIYGILLGFGMTYPDQSIYIFPLPFPIKGKWFVCIYAAIELFSALSVSSDGVAHVAHLGGMLVGYLVILYWRHQYSGGNDFNGWDGYEVGTRASVFTRVKEWFRKITTRKDSGNWHYSKNVNGKQNNHQSDDEEKQKHQQEIDRILEKIKRSGYDSLSAEERRKLFDRK